MTIDIKRGLATVASFKANEDVIFTQKLMGEHKITATVEVAEVMDVRLGDYIEYGGEVFVLNNMPEVTRMGNRILEYRFEFEGEIYKLYNKILMDEGSADFSYFGTPEDYLLLLLTNINEIDAGWTLGTVASAEPKNITFNNISCREALSRISEEFELEYLVSGQEISMVNRIGEKIFLDLEYGKGKGLYQLERKRLNDKGVITRLYAFGGRKNIDFDYRDGADRLVFANNPLQSNVITYGVVEGSITFEDIFPNRTGSVTDLPASGDIFSIMDNTLDFDINDQLLEGVTAKIVFKSGDLAGNQFEITEYDPATFKITFKEFTEENDYKLPNDTVKPALGDEYTLVDIKMPQSYIDTAEAELETKAQEYLDEHDHPRVTYAFNCDEIFFKENNIDLLIGDRVRIIDAELGIDSTFRISEVSFPLLYPKRITTAISEGVEYTTTEQIIRVTANTLEQIRTVDQTSNEQARLSQLRLRELQGLIYDPDGYFDTENIKPSSIETIHLAVGVKSQQFALSGIVFSPNQNAIPASFGWSGGELIHYEIEENLRTWQIAQGSIGSLLDGNAYYIFARVPIVGSQGGIVLDTAARKVDHEAGFYTLLIGVLHSVIDGVRGISLTYGTTEINGKFIRTGTITSQDGQTFFNLDAGVIGGKIQFESGSTGYQNLADIPGANPYFEQGTRLWSYNNNGEFVPENVIDDIIFAGKYGGKSLRVEGAKNLYYKNLIPVSTDRLYRGIFRVKQAVDATDPTKSKVLAGVTCYDANYNNLGSKYFIALNEDIYTATAFNLFEGEITGQGANENQFFQDTAYVRPRFIVNFSGGDGVAWIDTLLFEDITESRNAEDNSTAYTDALQNALGGLAYDDLVSSAQLDNTIIEGGYIKTSLIDVNTLIVSGDLETESGAQIKADNAQSSAENYADGQVGNLQSALGAIAYEDWIGLAVLDSTIIQGGYIKTSLIDVNTLIVSGGIETEQGATDKANAAESSANSYTDQLSSALIKTNPFFTKDIKFWSLNNSGEESNENVIDPVISGGSWGGNVLEIQGARSLYYSNSIPVDSTRIYKGKFRVRQTIDASASNDSRILVGVTCLNASYSPIGSSFFIANLANIYVSEGWRSFEGTITGEGSNNNQFVTGTKYVRPRFIVNFQNGDGTAQVDGLEFYDITEASEAEANANAYTDALGGSLGDLAFDDLVALAKLDSTIIQGGYIKTSLIDVDTLVARNVLTSTSGQRVHIDGPNNRMSFYDTAGSEVLRLDDAIYSGHGNPSGMYLSKSTRRSYLTSNGIYADGSYTPSLHFFDSLIGYGSLVGVLQSRFGSSGQQHAGVIGLDKSTSGTGYHYGGFFDSLFGGGHHFGVNRSSSGGTITMNDSTTFVSKTNTSGTPIVELLSNPQPGRLSIAKAGDTDLIVFGHGNNIKDRSGNILSQIDVPSHKTYGFIYDGVHWVLIFNNNL